MSRSRFITVPIAAVITLSLLGCTSADEPAASPSSSTQESIAASPSTTETSPLPEATTQSESNTVDLGDAYHRADGLILTVQPSIRFIQGDEGPGSDDYVGGYEEYHSTYGSGQEGAKVDLTFVATNSNVRNYSTDGMSDDELIDLSGLNVSLYRSGQEGFRLEFSSDWSTQTTVGTGMNYIWSWLYMVPSIDDVPDWHDLTVTISDSNYPEMGTVTFAPSSTQG
ncbi:hypothetical protein [Changpingibacter yushuensis]|uniref:hypothetical protein n=1 Tax=Changpingibacter yushuensis TaxID=2758440 RepID=UPI00165DEA5C|nr:hypothetical protein [Changpingibacter yushuensis]